MGTIGRIQAKKTTLTKASGSLSYPLIPKIIEFLDRVKKKPRISLRGLLFWAALSQLTSS
jgi:hypothetical protein